MAYETLIVEIEDYTCLIRLNRPEAMNALNLRLMRELAEAVTAADRNDKVRCIVLTGSDKAFAAGADVKEMAAKSYSDVLFEDLFGAEAVNCRMASIGLAGIELVGRIPDAGSREDEAPWKPLGRMTPEIAGIEP